MATGSWINDRTHCHQFKACFLKTSGEQRGVLPKRVRHRQRDGGLILA
jgi:hypothetical protein